MTAHEFGHNWGSEHDPDVAECSPAASHGGSYLMYTYSVSGYDVNNKVCSHVLLLVVVVCLFSTLHKCTFYKIPLPNKEFPRISPLSRSEKNTKTFFD